jgi:hypothetical protein
MIRMIRRIVGIILVVAPILIEALEHMKLIWDLLPTKYANMVSDPKARIIVFLVGLLVLALGRSEKYIGANTAEIKVEEKVAPPKPNLILLHCKESNLQALGAGGLVLAFRNDVLSSGDNARGVIAHISYSGPQDAPVEVNYGVWVEYDDYLCIDRSETKHLIVGIKEGRFWSAIENIAPQTHFEQHKVVPVGTLSPGEWFLKVTLTAENFKRDYRCKLIIDPDGSVKYSFPSSILT